MTVDFAFKKASGFTAATVSWKSAWSDARIRKEFESLAKWAQKGGLKTGRWMFRGDGESSFLVAIEVKGKFKGDGRVRAKTFPAERVASVTFDPNLVSPRVVYHGLTDWLRWRKKEGEVKRIGDYREVYNGNPWTDPKAWSKTDIQVVVRK